MSDDPDQAIQETILKYHLSPKSKPKEILDAAISEFGISEAGMYAAEMRHILYAHKYE
jgi:hypothetical protein